MTSLPSQGALDSSETGSGHADGAAVHAAGPVTYRELIDIAAAHLPAAAVAFAAHPPVTSVAAAQTVHAYRDLLHALGSHIDHVLTGHPRRLLVDETAQATLDHARTLRTALLEVVPARPAIRPSDHPETAIGHWTAAARAVRAATDLLATHTHHHDPTRARSPEATALRYLTQRGPAMRCLAALTAVVAETETPMRQLIHALRTRHGPVHVDLPDLDAVRAAAHAAAGPAVEPGEYPVLGGATVARPAIRTDNPLHKITDRVTAIRVHAWELLHQREPSLDAIVDIARLATQVEATRFRITAKGTIPLSAENAPKAGAWHRVWVELRGLRGLTGPHPDIREHADAVQTQLRDILRPGASAVDGGSGSSTLDPQLRRDLAVVLRDVGDQLAQTAPWTQSALHELAQIGTLYVPAGPAEIGEGTLTWVGGKPVWAAAPAPVEKIHSVNSAYRALQAAYADTPTSGPTADLIRSAPQFS